MLYSKQFITYANRRMSLHLFPSYSSGSIPSKDFVAMASVLPTTLDDGHSITSQSIINACFKKENDSFRLLFNIVSTSLQFVSIS